MKKTVSINLAGFAFQIDEDAFEKLEQYFNKIKHAFPNIEEQNEIIVDVEHRFAELFQAALAKKVEVVNLSMVNDAIGTLGDFANENYQETYESTNNGGKSSTKRKMFRSVDDKVFSGVLGGLGVYFGIDAVWLRLLFVILAIASIGIPIGLIYIVLWVILPKAETASQKLQMQGEPVNLSSISESVKKNLSSESLTETSKNVLSGIGEILLFLFKAFIYFLLGVLLFTLVVTTFAWFGSTFFVSFFGTDIVRVLFESALGFMTATTALYFVFILPILFALYWAYQAINNQKINWGKSIGIAVSLILICFIILGISAFTIFRQFSTSETEQNYIDVPFTTENKQIAIAFEESELEDDFQVNYNFDIGQFKTGGFSFDDENNSLYLKTVRLQIEPSIDTTFTLIAESKSRGKNKVDAKEHLKHFNYSVSFNNNSISIPTTLQLTEEQKFRMQELTYILKVPVGTQINFKGEADKYLKNVKIKDEDKHFELAEQNWEMTDSGLDCMNCK